MLWRWWHDWRERRAALREMDHLQWRDEAVLMDQNQNPITQAKLSLTSGDPVTAAAEWERAKTLVPKAILNSPDALDVLIGLQRWEEAEALMWKRQKRSFGDLSYLTGLARIAEHRGDNEGAVKRWRQVRDSAEGYLGGARCLVRLGRIDEAEALLKQGLRGDSDNVFVLEKLAEISNRRRDWPESLRRWQQMAVTYRHPAAAAHAANAMIELGRLDEAEASLAESARLYSANFEIALTRARLADRRDDLTAACDRWTMVRAVNPYFQAGYQEGANRLTKAGRHAEADVVLGSAIERFSDQAWPMEHYARLAHARADWAEAASRWATFRQRFPAEEVGYSLGAEALKAAGRDDEAAALHRPM
jgi:tetratricopeptide (TPR) repeat protein